MKRAQAMKAEVRCALDASHRDWIAMRDAAVKCAAKQARMYDDAMCASDAVREIRERFDAAFAELAELRELALLAEYDAQLDAAQLDAAQAEFEYEAAS